MSDDIIRFQELRRRLFRAIELELSHDDVCLPDEGALEIRYFFPNYFDYTYGEKTDSPCGVEITLSCYTLGEERKPRWRARTLHEALDKLETSLERWTAK